MSNRRRPKNHPPRQHDGPRAGSSGGPFGSDPFAMPPPDPYEEARSALHEALLRSRGGAAQARQAAATLRQTVRLGPDRLQRLVQATAVDGIHETSTCGWAPTDLAEVVRRRLGESWLPVLAGLLTADIDRHRADSIDPAWRADVAALGDPVDPRRPDHLSDVLAVCGALLTLPEIQTVLPAPGVAHGFAGATASGADSKVLARVRALLAKAESTQYPEEAEALSGKAQQLISRHALDRMALHADQGQSPTPVRVRRMWIDPPYVLPKSHLVDAVAGANGCRVLVSDRIGFCTLVGEPEDIDAVEVLTTSLLVQADRAMLQRGSRTDRSGTSRTRSFRKAFLVSFANRIRDRLRDSADGAVAEDGRSQALVPLLAERQERVDRAFDETFPRVRMQSTTISNSDGWREGRAAADRARLEPGLEEVAAG